jgi:hypothetical protein
MLFDSSDFPTDHYSIYNLSLVRKFLPPFFPSLEKGLSDLMISKHAEHARPGQANPPT